MYGGGSIGEFAIGETGVVGQAIIPEVVVETKQLVLAIEIDVLIPGEEEFVIEGFTDGTLWVGDHGWTA